MSDLAPDDVGKHHAPFRLAIVASHPIQYYAPWFRELARTEGLEVKVFYLWNFGVSQQEDRGFKKTVEWDIPLLEGYEYEFVPNTSRNQGTHQFWGLQNPTLRKRIMHFAPDAGLLYGYKYWSLLRLILGGIGQPHRQDQVGTVRKRVPLIFRGDSHRLTSRRGVREWIRRALIAFVYQRFSAFLPVGGANRDYFHYHGVPEGKLFTAPHAVDNERFFRSEEVAAADAVEWRSSLGIPAGRQVILFVGKFEPIKRPGDLISAFLKAAPAGASLLLVGDGELAPMLREMAAGKAEIYFAPFQNQTQMPRTYAAGDVLVLPSSEESWGLVVNEAMCMGLPVIVSSHVGCARDLVHPNHTGLVFSAGDVDDLGRKLQTALSDPARLQKWGANAREQMDRYSYRQATEGLVKSLEPIMMRGVKQRTMDTSDAFSEGRPVRSGKVSKPGEGPFAGKLRVGLWCPELLRTVGGIQAYSSAVLNALSETLGESQISLRTKNDEPGSLQQLAVSDCASTGTFPLWLRTPGFAGLLASSTFKTRPDLIITTHLNFAPMALLLKRWLGIPYIVCLHGVECWNLQHAGRRRALREADLLLPVSGFTARRVARDQGISEAKFRVLPNTVDHDRFTIGAKPEYLLQRYGIGAEHPVILTVGRQVASTPYKGQDRLLQALPEIRKRLPRVRCIIVGDGDDRPRLEKLADRLEVRDAVIFAGLVSDSELVDHYRLCDVFAMVSKGEGFGIAYLEAMACGKPAVGGNQDAAQDALRDGELGVLVDPDNNGEIAATLTAILDRSYRHPLMFNPEALRAAVIGYFGFERFASNLADFIASLNL